VDLLVRNARRALEEYDGPQLQEVVALRAVLRVGVIGPRCFRHRPGRNPFDIHLPESKWQLERRRMGRVVVRQGLIAADVASRAPLDGCPGEA